MSANDVILIGPFRYNVLKREGNRILVCWTEATGVYKEIWISLNKTLKVS